MSAQVLDFFSKKPVTTKQNTEANDRSSEDGVYIGKIGKEDALAMRTMLAVLEGLYERLMELTSEIQEVDEIHQTNIMQVVTMLGAQKKYSLYLHDLSISEDGHVWLVDRLPPFPDEE